MASPMTDVVAIRKTMANWRTFRGAAPFSSLDSSHAEDRAAPILGEATAILSMLSAACADAQKITGPGGESDFDSRHFSILAGALEGVETLINLAAFMLEDEK